MEVLSWWYGSRDFFTGTMLYGRYGRNAVLKATLNKPGKEKSMSGKLQYELCKAVGLNWKKMPSLPDDAEILIAPGAGLVKKATGKVFDTDFLSSLPQTPKTEKVKGADLPVEPYSHDKFVPIISDSTLSQYPKVIRRLKMEYQENYQVRSMLHKKMTKDIPDNNAIENVTKRKELLVEIHTKSARMEYLYRFIKKYEDYKVVPLEEEVWPREKTVDLPDDIEELKRLKKNLQTNNSKDSNLLLYQQKTKAEKENPMPVGPKRTRIELRIKKKEKEILAIDNKIVELENK